MVCANLVLKQQHFILKIYETCRASKHMLFGKIAYWTELLIIDFILDVFNDFGWIDSLLGSFRLCVCVFFLFFFFGEISFFLVLKNLTPNFPIKFALIWIIRIFTKSGNHGAFGLWSLVYSSFQIRQIPATNQHISGNKNP